MQRLQLNKIEDTRWRLHCGQILLFICASEEMFFCFFIYFFFFLIQTKSVWEVRCIKAFDLLLVFKFGKSLI